VKEEIATREATSLGFDRDDTIIRRRLRQKLEFLVEDAAEAAPPTEAELQAWLDAHPEPFRAEPQIAFRQLYLSPDRRRGSVEAEAARLLARLQGEGPEARIDELGDPIMLPQELPLVPRRETARLFGESFADRLMAIEPGTWAGPVESGYGLHLVFVRERVPGSLPELSAVRPLVERELLAERRRTRLETMYERLLEKYTVVVEWPKAERAPGEAPAADGGASRGVARPEGGARP
jgi:hypothetical protein